MAITNNGTKNNLPAAQLPAGYSRPTITEFPDWEYRRVLALTILKTTVEDAAEETTMANILNDAVVGIDKQITDIVAATFIATQDVTTWASWDVAATNISNNSTGDSTWLTDTAESYTATVILYIKSV